MHPAVPVFQPASDILLEDLPEARDAAVLQEPLVEELTNPEQQRDRHAARAWLRRSPHELADLFVAVTDEREVTRSQIKPLPKVIDEIDNVADLRATSLRTTHGSSDHLRHQH